jgi:hypothetical protein
VECGGLSNRRGVKHRDLPSPNIEEAIEMTKHSHNFSREEWYKLSKAILQAVPPKHTAGLLSSNDHAEFGFLTLGEKE